MTNDVRQHHYHKQKIYLLRIFPIDPASISVRKGLFSSKQHRSTRRNNSLHPGYHWSREPITTLSRPSVFMLEFSGQLTTPDKFSYHTGWVGTRCHLPPVVGVLSWPSFPTQHYSNQLHISTDTDDSQSPHAPRLLNRSGFVSCK